MQTTSDVLSNLPNRKAKKRNLMKLFGRGFLDPFQRGIKLFKPNESLTKAGNGADGI